MRQAQVFNNGKLAGILTEVSDSEYIFRYDDLYFSNPDAHRANDAAVLEAYGFPKDASEPEIMSRLFKCIKTLPNK